MTACLIYWLARLTAIQEVPGSIPGYTLEIFLVVGYTVWKTTAEETIVYKESNNIKEPLVTGKMLEKMEERRKWKNINTEEAKRNYRKLNNELRRETNKADEEWMKQNCEEIE